MINMLSLLVSFSTNPPNLKIEKLNDKLRLQIDLTKIQFKTIKDILQSNDNAISNSILNIIKSAEEKMEK